MKRRPPQLSGSNSGGSLTEVVVATAIFASTVLGLMNSFLNTRKATFLTENTSAAVTLAQDKLEQIRTLAASSTDLTAGVHSDSLNPLSSDGTTGGIFTRRWTVTDNTPTTGMKRVEMQVSWSDRIGTPSITLVALEMP